jgi:type II secretory pathway pseudopilin PulG
MFQSDLGGYPMSTNTNLYNCLVKNTGNYKIGSTVYSLPKSNWSGPYMTFKDGDLNSSDEIIDAWGTALTYANPDTSGHGGYYVDIISYGPDRVVGGTDNVTNWTR